MKTLDVLDRNDLKNEYKRTDQWIRVHGRAAGGEGKPMTWDREQLELYLREQFWKRRLEQQAKDQKIIDIRSFIDSRIRDLQSKARDRIEKSETLSLRGGRRQGVV